MAKIKITNERQFEEFLQKNINKKMELIVKDSESFLMKQSEILRDTFANSQEFRDLSGRLVGEFGFTQEEVRDLSKILALLTPGSEKITTLKVTQSNTKFAAILEWVDFDRLKDHPLAQHDLTRLDRTTGQFELTETISWIDWLENGAVVRGYSFEDVGSNAASKRFSRSKKGIMRKSSSGFWEFSPTRVLETIGERFSKSEFERGFGVVLRRRRR